MGKDRIYAFPRENVGQFVFDDQVAEVFPDMIARSVPGYASILSVIEQLAGRFAKPKTNLYDLGCSLGAATLVIRGQAPADAVIHAIDNSPAMTDRLKKRLQELDRDSADVVDSAPAGCLVQVHTADVCEHRMENASMVVLNFTLQFVDEDKRRPLLQNIFDSLLPGGALLLSEKVCFEDPNQQRLLNDLHLDFKRAHGYSELEISQKRSSLENTLVPESIDQHVNRLRGVGFTVAAPWFQCFNFASILAVKESAEQGTSEQESIGQRSTGEGTEA